MEKIVILGTGMMGLTAGYPTHTSVYDETETPGGICRSYYVRSVKFSSALI